MANVILPLEALRIDRNPAMTGLVSFNDRALFCVQNTCLLILLKPLFLKTDFEWELLSIPSLWNSFYNCLLSLDREFWFAARKTGNQRVSFNIVSVSFSILEFIL